MKTYRAELHVHTVLSPCAAVEMIPPLIIETALDRGINLIAITDHNASENVLAVQEAAKGKELFVLPGMELQTNEEVHVLCLFDTLEQTRAWQDIVNKALPEIENKPDFFGEQFVVDETGDFIRTESRLLITAAELTLKETWEKVTSMGGMVIPAHVNRKGFGLFPTLGMIPTDITLEALEISRHITLDEALAQYPQLEQYPLLKGGDVHYLDEFLGANIFQLEQPTIAEIRLAFRQKQNRRFSVIESEHMMSGMN